MSPSFRLMYELNLSGVRDGEGRELPLSCLTVDECADELCRLIDSL